ncbi:tetratricopeptide repeat protein, partial [Nostoc sp.]|uniref:tetratricopeptide repeat protein n=1 Tax=Nostoc sp. TaxID=1180 RepID=UPI002FFB5584
MADKQGNQNPDTVFNTQTRVVRIYQREYQLPVLLSESFQQRNSDIRQRCQLVKEGRRTFLGLSRKPLSVDESLENLNSLMNDYESIIDFIQAQKTVYTQFFADLVDEIKCITTKKYQKISALEDKRTILVRRAGQDPDLQLIYRNQQSQLLKAAQLVGSASLLMLKKLELIQGAFAKLADDQEVQRQVFDEMLGHLRIYSETHKLQKEIADIQQEAAEMARGAIDFDKYIGEYLGSLQGLINEVVNIDQKLSIGLEEIKDLTNIILGEAEISSINSDPGLSDSLMSWLTQSSLKESRLTDALKEAEKQTLFTAEIDLQMFLANTESDSVLETVAKIQGHLEPFFNSNNAIVCKNRGIACRNQKDYEGAIADFSQALKLDPNYIDAYYNRGFAYFDLKDYDSAIADFNQALKLDPSKATDYYNRGLANAYYNRGTTYYELKDHDSAIADFNQALKLDPNYFNQVLKLDSNYTDAYYNR